VTRIPIHGDHPSGHTDHPSDLHVETVAFSLERVVAFPRNHWSPSPWNRWSPSRGIRKWLTYLAWNAAALTFAWLRERRKGNQAAVAAKLKGIRAGMKAEIPPPPALPSPGVTSGDQARR
jgi:hypothetical protein